MSMEQKIIDYLKSESDWVPTLKISKAVCGAKGTKKMVNPVLYNMLKKGAVERQVEENGSKPRWRGAPARREDVEEPTDPQTEEVDEPETADLQAKN